MNPELNFKAKLIKALSSASYQVTKRDGVSEPRFEWGEFFPKWFREFGHGYFFLFKKNLRVTNIQYAELVAMLRTNLAAPNSGKSSSSFHFTRTEDVKEWVFSLIDAFNPSLSPGGWSGIADLYEDMFRHTIVFDPYFTSAAVFVPPEVDLDLAGICASSGYIHSCGYSVYIRKAEKSEDAHLFEALNRHLIRHPLNGGKKLFFAAYAHEDFTKDDREDADALRHGLDGVKVYLEKFHLANRPLVEVLKTLARDYEEQLKVAEPGRFLDKHPGVAERELQGIDTSRTLWLIRDRDIDETAAWTTPDIFLICYDQRFINHNPFHLFDENKPAWIAHTTIPHTLSGAMLNITRPVWATPNEAYVADPFAGTGTLWFETLKLNASASYFADKNPLAPLLSKDNLEFFSMEPAWLCSLCQALTEMLEEIQVTPRKQDDDTIEACKIACPLKPDCRTGMVTGDELRTRYVEACDLAKAMGGEEPEKAVDAEDRAKKCLNQIKDWSLAQRIVFYLAMRTNVRHANAFDRGSRDWKAGFAKETWDLQDQIAKLVKLWIRAEGTESGVKPIGENTRLATYAGRYSPACIIPRTAITKEFEDGAYHAPVKQGDAVNFSGHDFSAVITDPPYGFNTKEKAEDLATLWKKAFTQILKAVKDGGDLVLCLPHRSHIGKGMGSYTQAAFVLRQLSALADPLGLEITNLVTSLPKPANAEPWFYWESEKALRRAILHLRVTRR